MRNQALIGVSLFALGLWLAYEVGGGLRVGDLNSIALGTFVFVGLVIAVMILPKLAVGFLFFSDVAPFRRSGAKVHGQQHGALLRKRRAGPAHEHIAALQQPYERGARKVSGSKFLLLLVVFVWLGLMQIFNSNSPHVLYGLLGFKIYFFYIPLMYVGYALIRNDEDLRKFIVVNASLAGLCHPVQYSVGLIAYSACLPTRGAVFRAPAAPVAARLLNQVARSIPAASQGLVRAVLWAANHSSLSGRPSARRLAALYSWFLLRCLMARMATLGCCAAIASAAGTSVTRVTRPVVRSKMPVSGALRFCHAKMLLSATGTCGITTGFPSWHGTGV